MVEGRVEAIDGADLEGGVDLAQLALERPRGHLVGLDQQQADALTLAVERVRAAGAQRGTRPRPGRGRAAAEIASSVVMPGNMGRMLERGRLPALPESAYRASANWGVFPGTGPASRARSASMPPGCSGRRIASSRSMVLVELLSSLALGAAATALGLAGLRRRHDPLVLGLLGLAEFVPASCWRCPPATSSIATTGALVGVRGTRDGRGGGAGARARRRGGRHGRVAALRARVRLGGRKRVRRPDPRPAARGGHGGARPGPDVRRDDVGRAGGDGGGPGAGRDHADGRRSRAVPLRRRVCRRCGGASAAVPGQDRRGARRRARAAAARTCSKACG